MKSLRRTLAVRFCLTMLVALTAIAGWVYLGVQGMLREQLDRSLQSAAQLQLDDLAAFGATAMHTEPLDRQRFVRELNRLVVLRDSTGRILAANTALARELPLDSASLVRTRHGEHSFATGPWLGGRVRALYVPAPARAPAGAAMLQVAASLEPLETASLTVLASMLGTVLLGALATLIGAGWLAGSSVAPVEAIVAQTKGITGAASGERITVHADTVEFESLVRVLNDMLARLEQAHDWHRRIIRDLGHDLRTPITAMRAGVELALRSERRPDEYRRVLASALEEIDRLKLISDALVFLGRLESGELTPNRSLVDARTIASEAIARAQQRVGAHVLSFTHPVDPVPVQADARLLGMVLDQLMDNAIRYTPPGTKIELSVAAADDHALVMVEDTGPGVPQQMLPYLFERFYRTDLARGRDGGPGLGLTAVAAIVELHHGTVRAERGSVGGLRICIHLPLSGKSPQNGAQEHQRPPEEAA